MITLRDYQQRAVDGVRAAFRSTSSCLFVLPTGGGKCLGRDTPVMKFNGRIVPVQDVQVGDLLMGPDSKPRRVVSLARGREQMFRVVPVKGDPYVVNESHILSLKMTAGNKIGYSDGEVVNLSVREYLDKSKTFKHCAKGWRVGVDFPTHSEPLLIPAYLMGVWLGDGSSRHFSVTTGDADVAQEMCGLADDFGLAIRAEKNSDGSVVVHLPARKSGRQFGRGGNPLCNALRHYGLVKNKHIPHRYLTGSREDRMQLLAGVIDTDGSWSGKGYDLTLKSERLIDDVIFLARSLGFSAYKRPARKVCTNNGKAGIYWRCSINGPVDQVPCRIDRKKAPPRRQVKNPLVNGISIEPLGIDDYYGFTLEGPDRLFLLGDFTVTHNTVTFSYIAQQAAMRRTRVGIFVHRSELVEQVSDTLRQFHVEHGIIAAGSAMRRGLNCYVVSAQTFARRVPQVPRFGLNIVDEAHHCVAGSTWAACLSHSPDSKTLGVTATPERLDGRGLGDTFDTMVMGPTVRELIDAGALSDYRLIVPPAVNLGGLHTRMGDYVRGEAAAAVDKPAITGDAIGHYRRHAAGKRAVAFCVTVAHAQHVASEFMAAGITAVAIDGGMDKGLRRDAVRDFKAGRIQVLTSCDLISEGFDLPAIEAAILLRPTQSLGLYLQQVGRALRVFPGKERAIIIDHVGNSGQVDGGVFVSKHGLPDDDRAWSLEGRLATKRAVSDQVKAGRQCPKCYAMNRPGAERCSCGHVFPIAGRQVDQVDGTLHEVNVEAERENVRRERMREQATARSLEQLTELGRLRGMKDPSGWARHVWAAREKKGKL